MHPGLARHEQHQDNAADARLSRWIVASHFLITAVSKITMNASPR
jgi:hypothetical protein